MIRLNLGCGQYKKEGYVNLDKYDSFAPDIVWDLECVPWPFEAGSVAEVEMRHCLEHMGASTESFLGIMKELYRVCAPDAVVAIEVPHPRCDSFTGDPTHVRPITPQILALFSKRKNQECRRLGLPDTPLATYIDVDFETTAVEYVLSPSWGDRFRSGAVSREELEFAATRYFNVITDIKIKLAVRKP
jgi:hypothetical protein